VTCGTADIAECRNWWSVRPALADVKISAARRYDSLARPVVGQRSLLAGTRDGDGVLDDRNTGPATRPAITLGSRRADPVWK
jgi:hypothetical protein